MGVLHDVSRTHELIRFMGTEMVLLLRLPEQTEKFVRKRPDFEWKMENYSLVKDNI